MHVEDIEAGLASGNRSGIEDAFRALVGDPGEDRIENVETADHLSRLLRICAKGLADDDRQMPSSTRELLDEVAGDEERPAMPGLYSAGAAVVLAHLAHFHELFGRALFDLV